MVCCWALTLTERSKFPTHFHYHTMPAMTTIKPQNLSVGTLYEMIDHRIDTCSIYSTIPSGNVAVIEGGASG
jgi:hypothetical protein